MAYRIDYQATKKVRGLEKRTAAGPALGAACLLISLLAGAALWPRGVGVLRELLIPGDPAVTVAALEALAEDLHNGESVQGALTDFCTQVAALDPS